MKGERGSRGLCSWGAAGVAGRAFGAQRAPAESMHRLRPREMG
jgi:hypothetical protein